MRLRTGPSIPPRPDGKPPVRWSRVRIPEEAYHDEPGILDMGTARPHVGSDHRQRGYPRTPAAVTARSVWTDQAACDGYPPDWWFPNVSTKLGRQQETQAIAICNVCPVREQCSEDRPFSSRSYGIWGGINRGLGN